MALQLRLGEVKVRLETLVQPDDARNCSWICRPSIESLGDGGRRRLSARRDGLGRGGGTRSSSFATRFIGWAT